jgi:predicted P-loop ATPase
LSDYLGAEDTPLNRAIGRKMLTAAVRRVRHPGCKFDYVVVFEGKQGTGKSTVLRILAGEENFSDQLILHLDPRAQQEACEGVWIFELSELAGLRRTEIETVKSFITKTEDNVRPAYGRFRVDQPRRCIFVGTTNDSEYLRDATGNRRFLPVKTGTILLAKLEAERDQLWAEAAAAEAQGEPLTIPEHLYAAAAEQQEQRMMKDPWDEVLAAARGSIALVDGGHPEERISAHYLLAKHLELSGQQLNDGAWKRLRNAMHRLGWQGPKKMRFETETWEPGGRWQVKSSVVKQGYWRSPPG